MPPPLLLSSQPGFLHRSYAVVCEFERIIGEKLHLTVVEKQDETLGDVARHLHVCQVIAAD
jgi:hypothetical protein